MATPVAVRSGAPLTATVGDEGVWGMAVAVAESAAVVFARPKSSTFRWFPYGDEEVRGLDVAMDDPAAMRCVERVSNLPGEIEYARDRDRSCFDQFRFLISKDGSDSFRRGRRFSSESY